MDARTIETYDQLAHEYDQETVDFWDRFPRSAIDLFAEEVGTGTVLDVGSGPGRDGLLLQEKELRVVCVDASEAMVKISTERGLETVQADFLKLPFDDNTFDGVWAYTSLLHVRKSEINTAFSEIRRVLKVNGVIGLGLIEGDGESYRESSGVNQPRWFAYYTKTELEQLLQQHSFEVTHFESWMPRSKNYMHFIARKV